jgi:hypothetical protein
LQKNNQRDFMLAIYSRQPNPDKPEPKLTAKTKNETKKIEFGAQELTKIKTIIS